TEENRAKPLRGDARDLAPRRVDRDVAPVELGAGDLEGVREEAAIGRQHEAARALAMERGSLAVRRDVEQAGILLLGLRVRIAGVAPLALGLGLGRAARRRCRAETAGDGAAVERGAAHHVTSTPRAASPGRVVDWCFRWIREMEGDVVDIVRDEGGLVQ